METHFLFSYLLALAVVGLMLFGLYAAARALSHRRAALGSSGKRLIGVIASAYVSPNTTIHVVKVGSRYLIVGGGAGRLRSLGELPAGEAEAWAASSRNRIGCG